MPRQPRLDTPGALHHIMGRGIDGLEIFGSKKDCEDFLGRLQMNTGANLFLTIFLKAVILPCKMGKGLNPSCLRY
jgi:hypothetical protein